MPHLDTILTVIAAGLALSASPGPSMFYVLSRSVGQSVTAGFASSIGLAIGGIVLAVLSAVGLATLIQHSPLAFTVLKICGGCYLCYLGYDMIRGAGKSQVKIEKIQKASFSRVLYQGILVELLNPKTAIFLLAFLPPFVDETRSDVTTQMLVLGILVPLTAIPSDIIVSLAGGSLAVYLAKVPNASYILDWVGAMILIGLAIWVFADTAPGITAILGI